MKYLKAVKISLMVFDENGKQAFSQKKKIFSKQRQFKQTKAKPANAEGPCRA